MFRHEARSTSRRLRGSIRAIAAVSIATAALAGAGSATAGVNWPDGVQTRVTFECWQGSYYSVGTVTVRASTTPAALSGRPVPDEFRIIENNLTTGAMNRSGWMVANQVFRVAFYQRYRLEFIVQYRTMTPSGWLYSGYEYGFVKQAYSNYIQQHCFT
jgi:hypothetical protein